VTLGAIVLAAGASERLGRPKQLVEIDGEPLVRRVATTVAGICDETCVVLGSCAEVVCAALGGLGVDPVYEPRWQEGMAASLRRGVTWAVERGHAGLAVFACDQGRLSTAHVAALAGAHRNAPASVIASRYAGVLGVPAVFSRACFEDLARLQGDQGARAIVRAAREVVAVDWPDGIYDLDTAADVAALSPSLR
jgi:CTP:molybdopterin cytidylyltransferase MocA